MSGYLCLKWNNHCTAIQKSISNIQIKERYCDATIVCQEKYFPVHRIILSMCSDYFDGIFGRMQCQHPYIVFKDIQPNEMEMLLNYMYQGEVNVVQEMLPSLIQAAEILKIKGLAVPDEPSSRLDSTASGRKRSNSSSDNPQPKRRSEEGRRRRDSLDANLLNRTSEYGSLPPNNDSSISPEFGSSDLQQQYESKLIKEEPSECERGPGSGANAAAGESGVVPLQPPGGGGGGPAVSALLSSAVGEALRQDGGNAYADFPAVDDLKTEAHTNDGQHDFDKKPSAWSDISRVSMMQTLHPSDITRDSSVGDDDESVVGLCVEKENFVPSPTASNSKSLSLSPSVRQCPYCNYEGHSPANVKRHIKYKHTGERPFPCSLCFARFAEKFNLDRHMRSHTGERPFQCPVCPKKFSSKLNLKNHIDKTHIDKNHLYS